MCCVHGYHQKNEKRFKKLLRYVNEEGAWQHGYLLMSSQVGVTVS